MVEQPKPRLQEKQGEGDHANVRMCFVRDADAVGELGRHVIVHVDTYAESDGEENVCEDLEKAVS